MKAERKFMNKILKNKLINLLLLVMSMSIFAIFFSHKAELMTGIFREKKSIPIYRVNTEEKKIAITFDVNWAEKDYLESILNVLKKYNAKGTFFIMGAWVNYSEENLQKLKMIYSQGHEIGNHSYSHQDFTKISPKKMIDEIQKTEDIINKNLGVKTNLFRCPSGAYNDTSVNTVNSLNYQCIQWDVDSVDWKESGRDIEYNRVIKKVKPGSIVLFHNNAKYTPENLDRILKKLSNEGYKFVTVGELTLKNNYKIERDGTQYSIK